MPKVLIVAQVEDPVKWEAGFRPPAFKLNGNKNYAKNLTSISGAIAKANLQICMA